MRFSLTFKTPDVLDQLNESQRTARIIKRFIQCGEYVTITFDEAGTVTVEPVEKRRAW